VPKRLPSQENLHHTGYDANLTLAVAFDGASQNCRGRRRRLSTGRQTHDIAQALGLGEETVRSHLKKAQAKLGVRNRTHATCEALRQDLIP
jgi:Bacterial regulatory proteins, luxR family